MASAVPYGRHKVNHPTSRYTVSLPLVYGALSPAQYTLKGPVPFALGLLAEFRLSVSRLGLSPQKLPNE